jgi:hypothetical protein
MTNTPTSGVAQALTGTAFAGLCGFAIITDITNNLNYFGPINAEFAGITVAAAIGIALLPWKRWGALKGVCLALTCWAAAAAYANSLGLDIAKNVDAGAVHAAAIADATAARATIARITETADAATLATMADAAKVKATAADAKARERLGDDASACAKVRTCREAADAYAATLDRLSQAKARDTARAAIDKAEAKADVVGTAKVDVLAIKIASAFGASDTSTSQTIAIVLAVLAIAATQGLALLGHSSLSLIGEGVGLMLARRAVAVKVKPVAVSVPHVVNTGGKAKAKPAKLNREQALAKLLAHIEMSGGEIVGSGVSLAKMLGVPRSTVTDKTKGWLAAWIANGELTAEKRGNATVLTVAKKAA